MGVCAQLLVPEAATDDAPVVFLHGWGGSAAGTWLASRLPGRLQVKGRSCLLIDLPGHGVSARLAGASHNSEDYDSIVELVDEGLPEGGPFDIVGFSLGAKIGLTLAARRPERVRRLVAAGVGSNLFSIEPSGVDVCTILRSGVTADSPARPRQSAIYAMQSGGDPEAMGACLTRNWQPPTPAELRSISSPVLLAAGDQDEIVGSVDRLAECLPQARVHRLRHIDHLATPYAAELHELIVDFLI